MQIDDALAYITSNSSVDVGKFYAPGTSLTLGKGTIYDPVLYPIFDEERRVFVTAEGIAYILTHECDIANENDRLFNTDVLICPIIPLEDLLDTLQTELSGPQVAALLGNLGARNIFRLVYLPPIPPELKYGGVMYLNHIANTSVSHLRRENARLIAAVTGYGLEVIEYILENHLLRPKAERLAFVPESHIQ